MSTHRMRPLDRRAFLALGARAAGAAAVAGWAPSLLFDPATRPIASATPHIITRAQWGADERLRFRDQDPHFHPVRKFVVHHTATPGSDGNPLGRVRSIYLSHLHRRTEDGKPWQDIGYNFVVDEQGRVYEGRHARDYGPSDVHDGEDTYLRGVRGAHAGEWNGGSVGIAIIGTYDGARPTQASLEAVAQLIAWKCARHGLDPTGVEPWTSSDNRTRVLPTIVGHRDVRSTRCPGQGAYDTLPQLRRRVAELLGPVTRPSLGRDSGGYRIVHETGDVTRLGSAADLGSLPARGVATTVVGAAAVPGRDAYWIVDVEGGIHGFGDAPFHGSLPGLRRAGVSVGRSDVARLAATNADGYWMLDGGGGVFAFGGATFHGSVPALRLLGLTIGTAPVVAIEPAPGGGYWMLDERGGVFAFGGAPFHGSIPALGAIGLLPKEAVDAMDVVDLRAAPGGGYWILDHRGGVFAFGGAPFHGSIPATGFLGGRARRLVPAPSGGGYLILSEDGGVVPFGDAVFHGHGPHLSAVDLIVPPLS